MRVACVGNTGKDLPLDVRRLTSNLDTSVFPVLLGEVYDVHAIALWAGGTVHYLIYDRDAGVPVWNPADLFDVINAELPSNWSYRYLGFNPDGEPRPVLALWGYEELVRDAAHHDALLEADPVALEIFLRRAGAASAF